MSTLYSTPYAYATQPAPTYNMNNYNGHTNGPGFSFKRRSERIDWRRLAGVDVERVSRELDFKTLQDNISNIAFCSLETEIDVRTIDPNFLKLFRLSQLTIEYLLHSQQYLTDSMGQLEFQLKRFSEKSKETTKFLTAREDELRNAKRENKKRRKIIGDQQSMIEGSNNYHKCVYCFKAFLTPQYLQGHMERHHISPPAEKDVDKNNLMHELQLLKQKLQNQELNLEKERQSAREQALIDGKLDRLKDTLLRELKESTLKNTYNEDAFKQIINRYDSQYKHRDDVDYETANIRKQREDLAMLKETLNSKMAEVDHKLESTDRNWKDHVKDLKRRHIDEVRRLNAALTESNDRLRSSGGTDELRQMNKRIRDQARIIRDLENRPAQVIRERTLETNYSVPRSPEPVQESPVELIEDSPVTRTVPEPMVYEDDLEEDDAMLTDTDEMRMEEIVLPFTYSRSPRLLAALRKNPKLLKVLRNDVVKMLENDLNQRRIPAGTPGISDKVLKRNLHVLDKERQEMIEDIPDYTRIRNIFHKDIQEIAERQLANPRNNKPSQKVKFASPTNRRGTTMADSQPRSRNGSSKRVVDRSERGGSPEARSPRKYGGPPVQRTPSPPRPKPRSSMLDAPTTAEYDTPDQRRSRKQQKPYSDDETWTNWDDVSEIVPEKRREPIHTSTPSKKVPSPARSKSAGGTIVSATARSIEEQLSHRSAKKRAGAVDTFHRDRHHRDEEDSEPFSMTSIEESEPKVKSGTAHRGQDSIAASHNDSINTFASSAWGKNPNQRSDNKASLLSTSSWDSSIEDITLK